MRKSNSFYDLFTGLKLSKVLVGLILAGFCSFAHFGACPAGAEVKSKMEHSRVSANHGTIAASIKKVLNDQVRAWNRADLDQFMKGYLKSAKTSYTSAGEKIIGYEAIQANYLKKYGNKEKRQSMGTLTFSELSIEVLSDSSALCLGNWQLTQVDKSSMSGVFSLVFFNKNGSWKIIHDHTSLKSRSTGKSDSNEA